MSKPKRPTPNVQARDGEAKPSLDDVLALINERTRIRDWIAGLDAKREQTPPHVFTRVHADYEARLRGVEERLTAHTGSLNEELAALRGRLEKVDDHIRHHQDQRAEVDLRAHVGELDSAAVADAREASDAELARLTAEREVIEGDIARVIEFFAVATGKATVALPPTTPPRPSVHVAPVPPRNPTGFDELRFLNSVVGEKEGVAADAPPPSVAVKAAERASVPVAPPMVRPTAEKLVEQVAPVERVAPKPIEAPVEKAVEKPRPAEVQGNLGIEKETESPAVLPPKKPARQTIAMQQADMTFEPSDVPPTGIVKNEPGNSSLLDGLVSESSTEKPLAANVPSDSPLSLKSSAKNDAKTLKCRECGTMNGAAEWYCERCGAELSGM